MPIATDKARISTYIDQSLKDFIEKVARKEGRSLSNYMEQLLKKDAQGKGFSDLD